MQEAETRLLPSGDLREMTAPPNGHMPYRPAHIYILRDPRDGQVKYVGVTTQEPAARLCRHFVDARRSRKSPAKHWIKHLLANGMEPTMEVIETVPAGGPWHVVERQWIAHFRSIGAPLKNLTIGGDGSPGGKRTAESCAAQSARQMGWNPSAETRARMSAAAKARVRKKGETEKAIAAVRKETRSPETAERFRLANLGRTRSDEFRAKLSSTKKAAPPRDPSIFARGARHYAAKAVLMDGLRFDAVEAAAKHVGLTRSAVRFRIIKGRASYATD